MIGDAVNTAARVESATRTTGDDVLITGETHRRLRGGEDGWEERPSITLKGKGAVVTLYAPRAHDALMDAAADGWRPPDV